MKPSIFIGSSVEGLPLARAAEQQLTGVAEVTVWKDDFFRPNETYIEALVRGLERFDFALLVLWPDDVTNIRGVELAGARDNVIFELGLFIGSLGRERTFMLQPASIPMRVPSDLSGVVMATYEWPRVDGNYVAAVGVPCSSIAKTIQELGFSKKKVTRAIDDIREQQQKQSGQIKALQYALRGIVTNYEVDKLIALERPEPFWCWYSDDLYNEMRRLRALGFVQNYPGVGLREIRNGFKDKPLQFDLKHYFFVTPEGRQYLGLRNQLGSDAEIGSEA